MQVIYKKMPEVKKIFKGKIRRRKTQGKIKKKKVDDLEEHSGKDVRGWGRVLKKIKESGGVLEEARILQFTNS